VLGVTSLPFVGSSAAILLTATRSPSGLFQPIGVRSLNKKVNNFLFSSIFFLGILKGGTYVQAWSSSDALAKCPTQTLPAIVDNTQEERQANPNQPSVLWNAMVVPFLPMRVRGGIWYQGIFPFFGIYSFLY